MGESVSGWMVIAFPDSRPRWERNKRKWTTANDVLPRKSIFITEFFPIFFCMRAITKMCLAFPLLLIFSAVAGGAKTFYSLPFDLVIIESADGGCEKEWEKPFVLLQFPTASSASHSTPLLPRANLCLLFLFWVGGPSVDSQL